MSEYLKQQLPHVAEHYAKLSPEQRQFGLFHFVTIHTEPTSKAHIDKLDCAEGVAALVPFGNFEGGRFYLEGKNVEIDAPEGAIIIFNSRQRHGIYPVTGSRISISFIFHDVVFTTQCVESPKQKPNQKRKKRKL